MNTIAHPGSVQAAQTVSAGVAYDQILRIPVTVEIVVGSTTMPVAALMKLGRGAVIPLDRSVEEPVDIVVNGRLVARGEIIVLENDKSRIGVSLTEIIGGENALLAN